MYRSIITNTVTITLQYKYNSQYNANINIINERKVAEVIMIKKL
jgi:hypothetical protein